MKKVFRFLTIILVLLSFTSISAEEVNGPVDPNPYGIEFESIATTYGTKSRVCPEALGPCTISVQYSVTTYSSWSVSVSASIKNVVIDKLDVEVGIEYNYSTESSSAYSVTYDVSSGKYGSIYFTPHFRVIVFTFDDNVNGVRRCILKTPMKVGGFTDGYYELVER